MGYNLIQIITSFVRLIRLPNLVILVLTQSLVYATLPAPGCFEFTFDDRFYLMITATALLTAGGYAINDYFDTKIDVINKPQKVVLGKYMSRRAAMILHIMMTGFGVLIGFYLSWRLGFFNMAVATLLLLYSSTLKHRLMIGNLVIASLMGVVVLMVWLFDRGLHLDYVLFYSGFALLTGWIREIVKDMEDMEGDQYFGSKTVPIIFGLPRAKRIVILLAVTLLILLVGFVIYAWKSQNYLLAGYLVILIGSITLHFIQKMKQADRKADFSYLSQETKILILVGVLSMFFRCMV